MNAKEQAAWARELRRIEERERSGAFSPGRQEEEQYLQRQAALARQHSRRDFRPFDYRSSANAEAE
jgi:hypothetical protein